MQGGGGVHVGLNVLSNHLVGSTVLVGRGSTTLLHLKLTYLLDAIVIDILCLCVPNIWGTFV